LDVEAELLEAFQHSALATEYLVGVVPQRLWQMPPPGGRGRTIAAIVAHIQSVRRTFSKMGGASSGALPSLDRKTVTVAQARQALRRSTEQLCAQFESARQARQARVKGMPRRWVDMLLYLVQHDAHHRGQICALVRGLGHEFDRDDTMRLWGWKALPPSR
jgi:uncharacterized damage-inducible protein DinB